MPLSVGISVPLLYYVWTSFVPFGPCLFCVGIVEYIINLEHLNTHTSVDILLKCIIATYENKFQC